MSSRTHIVGLHRKRVWTVKGGLEGQSVIGFAACLACRVQAILNPIPIVNQPRYLSAIVPSSWIDTGAQTISICTCSPD
jgi:hypothetical protein